MRRFRSFFVFAFLAVWLTAAQHCLLEAANDWSDHRDNERHESCCKTTESCATDGCEVVEGDSLRPTTPLLKLPAPEFTPTLVSLFSTLVEPPALEQSPPAERLAKTLAWVPTWHFARRAAPLSRAPSCASA